MTVQEFKRTGPWVRMGDLNRAKRRFEALVVAGHLDAMCAARDVYAAEAKRLVAMKINAGATAAEANHFIQHLCTWLDRWQDYRPNSFDTPLLDTKEPDDYAYICRPGNHEWRSLEWNHGKLFKVCPEHGGA